MTSLLFRGGNCNFTLVGGLATAFGVPAFDLDLTGPTITSDVASMVSGALQAGIDKTVWVGYYDLSLATIDVGGALASLGVPAATIATILGYLNQVNIPPVLALVRNPVDQRTVQGRADRLNDHICAGVAAGIASANLLQPGITGTATCTRRNDAGINAATDIQNTAPGGSPHPSTAGHVKPATMVITKLR
jgi:hypothetical protein